MLDTNEGESYLDHQFLVHCLMNEECNSSDKSHRRIITHGVDVTGVPQPSLEATTYVTWPQQCQGGGKDDFAIKFWGPDHNDSSRCYCLTSAVPKGGQLQLGFGEEGPHPRTTTLQKVAMSIPFQAEQDIRHQRDDLEDCIRRTSGNMV